LPRQVIEAQDDDKTDINYNVAIDGATSKFTEVEKSDTARLLEIGFGSEANEILISGTQVVPEFGSSVILIFAMVTVVLIITITRILKVKDRML